MRPVGLQQPFSIQSRGVVGSVKMERAKVKLFALGRHGFHLLFLWLSGSSISFQDPESESDHSFLREEWKVTATCNLMKLCKTHCVPVTLLNTFSHWSSEHREVATINGWGIQGLENWMHGTCPRPPLGSRGTGIQIKALWFHDHVSAYLYQFKVLITIFSY